jgi:hypothetical protein
MKDKMSQRTACVAPRAPLCCPSSGWLLSLSVTRLTIRTYSRTCHFHFHATTENWRFDTSEIWRHVGGRWVPNVSKDLISITFRIKQKTCVCSNIAVRISNVARLPVCHLPTLYQLNVGSPASYSGLNRFPLPLMKILRSVFVSQNFCYALSV